MGALQFLDAKVSWHELKLNLSDRDRAATSTPSHPNVHGWTTPRQCSYLHAIASAQGSASQPNKTVQENTSQIKTFQTQALTFVEDSVRGDIINTEEFPFGISLLYLYRQLQQRRHSPGDRLSDYTIV